MKPATAASFSRGVAAAAVGLLDRRQQQRPALDEELVEDLVLGAEVVVDEPVGDPGLVGDVGDAGRVEALAGEDADRGVEDLAALVDGRRLRPSGARLRQLRPGVGLGPAVGERGQRLADPLLGGEVEVGGDEALPVGGDRRAPCPRGRRSPSGRRSRSAAAPRRPGSGRGRRPGSRSPAPAAAPPSGRGRWPR